MTDVFLNMLPSAIGVAISPLPVIAVILMLMSKRAAGNSLAFLIGWVGALVAISLVVLNLGISPDGTGESNTAVQWTKLVIGIVFLLLAAANWRKRPKKGRPVAMPKWMQTLDRTTWPVAFVLALLLAGANPKNLGLAFAGVAGIVQADLPAGNTTLAVTLFIAIASVSIVLPILYFFIARRSAKKMLLKLKGWLARYNAVIMAVLLLVIGTKIAIEALRALT